MVSGDTSDTTRVQHRGREAVGDGKAGDAQGNVRWGGVVAKREGDCGLKRHWREQDNAGRKARHEQPVWSGLHRGWRPRRVVCAGAWLQQPDHGSRQDVAVTGRLLNVGRGGGEMPRVPGRG